MLNELSLAQDDLTAATTKDSWATLGMYAVLGAGIVVLLMAFKKSPFSPQEG